VTAVYVEDLAAYLDDSHPKKPSWSVGSYRTYTQLSTLRLEDGCVVSKKLGVKRAIVDTSVYWAL